MHVCRCEEGALRKRERKQKKQKKKGWVGGGGKGPPPRGGGEERKNGFCSREGIGEHISLPGTRVCGWGKREGPAFWVLIFPAPGVLSRYAGCISWGDFGDTF